ncbi:MAG: hypothetical protein WC867_07010 [Candidatus Pacearchaeota archaeon]
MKFNKNLKVFYIFLVAILIIQIVLAEEILLTGSTNPVLENSKVAYVYRTPSQIEPNVVEVFNSLNFSIDYIMDSSFPMDLSKYRLIYIGDEYFTKDIPIDKTNVIVANPNIGSKDGLTKNGGVSKLTSTKPLRVEINGKYVQVYELTKDKKDMFIPYYFLNNLMKSPTLKKYAGADTISSGENYGDVIAYAKPGDVLLNGKILQGRLCFFGINQADFWTSESRQLFLDCTGYTATECRKDSDCGASQTSQSYCKDGDIYKDIKTYQCLKPGSVHSKCVSKSVSTIIQNCLKGCKTGSCLPDCTKDADCGKNKLCQANSCVQIACTIDADCGKDKFANQLFCKDGNVFDKYITYDCINPGTLTSKCSSTTSDKLFEKCFKGCSNGDCASQCTKNSECGIDEFVGESICKDGSVFQNKRTYICNSPGTAESKCSNSIVLQKKITCSNQETCSKGICVDLVCSNNLDCDDKNSTTEDFCINAGKANSACVHTITNYKNISQIKFILLYAYAGYNSVTLNFSAVSKDNTLINGYLLSKDHNNWVRLPGSSTGYVFRGLNPLTDYVFYVKAIDSSNISSDEISIYMKTLANPYQNNTNNGTNNNGTNNNGTNNQNNIPTISSLKAVAGTNYVTLLYSANSANGSTIKKYLVKKNNENWIETTKKNYTYSSLASDTSYTFYVKTMDSLNRTSKELAITIKTAKISGNNGTNNNNTNNNGTNNNGTNNSNNLPSVSSVSAIVKPTNVTLIYSATSKPGSTIKKYLVKKNNENWIETTKLNYTFSSLIPETNYIFYIKVVDSLDRVSKESNISVKTLKLMNDGGNNGTNSTGNNTNNQNNQPSVSSLTAIVGYDNVTLIYSATSKPGSTITSYYLRRNSGGWMITNKPNYTFTGLMPDTNYVFFIKVNDSLNRVSKEINISVKTAKKIETGGSDGGSNGGSGGSGGSGGGSGGSGGSSSILTGSGSGFYPGQHCLTIWNCNDWSKCRDKTQTRECIYPANFCEPYDPKPTESRVCIPEEPIPDQQLEEFNSEVNKDTPIVNEVKESPYSPITGAFIAATLGKHPWISLLILVFVGIGIYYYYSVRTKPLLKAFSKK